MIINYIIVSNTLYDREKKCRELFSEVSEKCLQICRGTVPKPCIGELSRNLVSGNCPETLYRGTVPKPCIGELSRNLVSENCPETLYRRTVPKPCIGELSRNLVSGNCPETLYRGTVLIQQTG